MSTGLGKIEREVLEALALHGVVLPADLPIASQRTVYRACGSLAAKGYGQLVDGPVRLTLNRPGDIAQPRELRSPREPPAAVCVPATKPGGLRATPVRCQPHEEATREPGEEVAAVSPPASRQATVSVQAPSKTPATLDAEAYLLKSARAGASARALEIAGKMFG
jgi:hypothetical protein